MVIRKAGLTMSKETIKQHVYDALNDNIRTREDDYVLIAEIIKKQNNEHLTPQEMQIIIDVFYNWRQYKMPNINTIIRQRRYLQTTHPHLINEKASTVRMDEERYYHDTYKNK